MKSKWIYIIIIIAGVGFAVYWQFNRSTPDAVASKPDLVVSASELIQAFEQDSTKANLQYSGKILRVSGTVTQVNQAGSLVLGSEGSGAEIVIGLDQRHVTEALQVKPGERAVLQGVYSGYERGGGDPDDLLSNLGATIQLRSAGLIKED